jgi:hypothetical protein
MNMKIAPETSKLARLLAVLAAILLPALHAAPAHAQIHLWVSKGGNDNNNCLDTFPCRTFVGALNQSFSIQNPTGDGIVLSCLDSGFFGEFTITMSVTIDCAGVLAMPSGEAGPGCSNKITVNAPGRVVNLRGLIVSGTPAIQGCETNGIFIQAATAVYVEDCVIEGFPQKGILDTRTTGLTKLAIKNTIVRDNGSAGIVAGAAPKNSVVLENVHSVNNAYGIAIATGNNVVISRSVMSENRIAGIEADPGAQVVVDNTEISHNVSYGVYALGTVTLANSDISFNTSSISGATMSYGNNRLFGNGGGDAPMLISQQ